MAQVRVSLGTEIWKILLDTVRSKRYQGRLDSTRYTSSCGAHERLKARGGQLRLKRCDAPELPLRPVESLGRYASLPLGFVIRGRGHAKRWQSTAERGRIGLPVSGPGPSVGPSGPRACCANRSWAGKSAAGSRPRPSRVRAGSQSTAGTICAECELGSRWIRDLHLGSVVKRPRPRRRNGELNESAGT